MYFLDANTKSMIKKFLLQYTQIPDDDLVDADQNSQIRHWAQQVLSYVYSDVSGNEKELEKVIKANKQKLQKNFRFEDSRRAQSNYLVGKGLSKCGLQKLLCELRGASISYHDQHLSHRILIDIKGYRINNGHLDASQQHPSLIHQALNEFLAAHSQRVFLLQGETGAGKSILLHEFEKV